jgi:hypothetical protein
VCDFISRRTTWCVSRSLSSRARRAPRALDPLASLPRRRGSRRKSHRPLRAPSRFPQPAVPETALKRRKRDDAWAAKKAAADAEAKAKAEKNSKEIFTRAEKYVKEYRDQVSIRHVRRFRARQRPARKTPMFPRAPGPAAATALAPPAPRTPRDGRRRSHLPPGSRARRGPPRVAPSRGTRRRVLASAAASRPLGLSLGLRRGAEGRRPKTRPGLSTVHRSSVSLPRPPADHIPSSPIVRFRHRRRLTSSGSSARLAPRVAFTSSPRRSSCS